MKYPGYRKMDLRELQLLQLSVMKKIHHVCVENNINYYMISGTLLGAIRHKGFIPWDDDIDIAMMRPDYDRFMSIFKSNFDTEKFFLQHYESDQDFRPAMQRVCIKDTIQDYPSEYHFRNCKNTYIDIFPLDNVPDDQERRSLQQKELACIDKWMNMKLYHVYDSNSKVYVLLKKSVSFLLKIIPISFLQKRRVDVMTMYAKQNTKCVASTVSKYGYTKQIIDRNIYGTPKLYVFEDTEFYGVEHYDQYLTHLFGKKYMELPPEDKRLIPNDVYIRVK